MVSPQHPGVREVEAKGLLIRTNGTGEWFGGDYTFNVYRGCQHRCVYCDSRSECYGIDDFDSVVHVKINAPELLERQTARKHAPTTLSAGAMSDPYTPVELRYGLTRKALEIAVRRGLGINLQTKSDLVVRDIDLLQRLVPVRASVVFTITTVDDELAAKIEPHAPPPSRRLAAMSELAAAGIKTGTAMMPVLPFINDTDENAAAVARATAAAGGSFVVPWFGVTLRDRQREHFYRELDRMFPGVSGKYMAAFGGGYECESPGAAALYEALGRVCDRLGILHRMRDVARSLQAKGPRQISLFDE